MQNMDYYYDFSGQKFDYPLSLSMNGFSRTIFSRQSSLEISYVLKGSYEAITSHFSSILQEHEMIVIAPYDLHLLRPKNEGIILTLHIDFSRMPKSMTGNYQEQFTTDLYSVSRNAKAYARLQRKIGELVEELMQEGQNLYHLNAIMMEVLYILSSHVSFDLPLHTEYYENYMKAIQYIDDHFKEDITLSQIAHQLSFSTSYTSKLMKKYMGIPFVKYLAYVRIRASLESLLEGRKTIEQISQDCGMPNSKSYTVFFKELYGISPSAYRKQFQMNMKYSKTAEKKKMELDLRQKELLKHLLEEKECIYEDAQIKIMKDQNKFHLKMEPGQVVMNTTPEGETNVDIVFP